MTWRRICAAAFAAGLLLSAGALVAPSPAGAAAVRIIVNGQEVTFDQPPIERNGRVFVPLRGVFERLGASVVYSNGVINATGNGRTIQLHIGSNTALVNGQTQMIDVAPFLVGARTLVPLRFVSQALGATVDYNSQTRAVTIASAVGVTAPPPPPPPASANILINLNPGAGVAVIARRPAISGSFAQPVDPNSVRITLDGRDVSATSYVSSTSFLFSPTYDLVAGQHTVRVTGTTTAGMTFDQSWTFVTGANASTVGNFINQVSPPDGTTVASTFTVSGTTLPGSGVHIAAIGTANVFGIFTVGTGSYVTDVTADPSGRFSATVALNVGAGSDVGVRITSTAPVTRASAVVSLHYHT